MVHCRWRFVLCSNSEAKIESTKRVHPDATRANVAMTVCLITLYPKNKLFVFFALLYALYVGLGVSVSIHWFSEFVAGAIIGSVIGTVVGRSFRVKLV
jgi:hypothetical protein